MKYGEQTSAGCYYKKSLTNKYRSAISNEAIKRNIKAIWLEHDEEDDNDYIMVYFKDDQSEIWNAYDEVPMTCTRVPDYEMSDADRINDWLQEIAYVKQDTQ